MNQRIIYADNAATTKISQKALDAMMPLFNDIYGNPSSVHIVGQRAAAALQQARITCAKALGCHHSEIFFTSGGSEADNQAIISAAALGAKQNKKHIVSTAMEHHAMLHTLEELKKQGFEITLLRPAANGIVSADQVKNALREDTCLVSIMYANNETGAIQPISQIGALCHERGILFHTDAVQAVGHTPIDIAGSHIDLLSLSAHKFHGPRGIGLLYARRGIELTSVIRGGGQERGKRAGTENMPAIAGLATALEEAIADLDKNIKYVTGLREQLRAGFDAIPGATLNGDREHCLPGTINYRFDGVSAEALLSLLSQQGICVSSGSACSAGSIDPSHVLLALGLTPAQANSSLRFTIGEDNTPEEIDIIIKAVTAGVARLRK